MPEQFRVHDRIVTYLDSAPWPQGVVQHVAPAGLEDAGRQGGPVVPAQDTVVLIHAFPMNADMWEAQLDAPAPAWRYVAPDLRGFGRADAGEAGNANGPSIDDYARDVLALLDHLRVGRAVIVGLSMGGYAAFALLRLSPARVRGLVLANTRTDADGEEARRGRAEMLDTLAQGGVAAVADALLPRLLGRTTRTERSAVEQRVRAIAEANSAAGVRDAILRMMSRPDSSDLVRRVACPTLVIASDEDTVTPADQAREMQGRIPGSELAVIQGAGHLSNLEQPRDFNVVLQRFLATRFGA